MLAISKPFKVSLKPFVGLSEIRTFHTH